MFFKICPSNHGSLQNCVLAPFPIFQHNFSENHYNLNSQIPFSIFISCHQFEPIFFPQFTLLFISPYFLTNTVAIVSLASNNTNFHLWSRSINVTLRYKNKLGFIDETLIWLESYKYKFIT